MNDCKGNEIEIGDTVVVAHRSGSSQWLDQYEVVDYACPHPVLRGTRNNYSRKTNTRKTSTFNFPYQGSQRAIQILTKGPGYVKVKPILEGDEHIDPVPGVKW